MYFVICLLLLFLCWVFFVLWFLRAVLAIIIVVLYGSGIFVYVCFPRLLSLSPTIWARSAWFIMIFNEYGIYYISWEIMGMYLEDHGISKTRDIFWQTCRNQLSDSWILALTAAEVIDFGALPFASAFVCGWVNSDFYQGCVFNDFQFVPAENHTVYHTFAPYRRKTVFCFQMLCQSLVPWKVFGSAPGRFMACSAAVIVAEDWQSTTSQEQGLAWRHVLEHPTMWHRKSWQVPSILSDPWDFVQPAACEEKD